MSFRSQCSSSFFVQFLNARGPSLPRGVTGSSVISIGNNGIGSEYARVDCGGIFWPKN